MLSKKQYEALFVLFMAAILISLPYLTSRPQLAHHKLLVAAETLKDGVFDKTVVLMLRHDSIGAMGLILNRSAEGFSAGGPVDANSYHTVHSTDVKALKTMVMEDLPLAMTEGEAFAESISSMNPKPKEYIVFKGYVGWGMGQLDREIARGSWKVVEFDRNLVFHTDPKVMWEQALRLPEVMPEK